MTSIKLVALGVGITLLVLGGLVGLWSMTIAPPPPSIAVAKRMATSEQAATEDLKEDLRRHASRAATEITLKRADLFNAHALVMAQVHDELAQRAGSPSLPREELAQLRSEVCLVLTGAGRPLASPALQPVVATCEETGAPRPLLAAVPR